MLFCANDIGLSDDTRYLRPGGQNYAEPVPFKFVHSSATVSGSTKMLVHHGRPHPSDTTDITYVLQLDGVDTSISVTMGANDSDGSFVGGAFDPPIDVDGILTMAVKKAGSITDHGDLQVSITINSLTI
jgi:hypothetical protein